MFELQLWSTEGCDESHLYNAEWQKKLEILSVEGKAEEFQPGLFRIQNMKILEKIQMLEVFN